MIWSDLSFLNNQQYQNENYYFKNYSQSFIENCVNLRIREFLAIHFTNWLHDNQSVLIRYLFKKSEIHMYIFSQFHRKCPFSRQRVLSVKDRKIPSRSLKLMKRTEMDENIKNIVLPAANLFWMFIRLTHFFREMTNLHERILTLLWDFYRAAELQRFFFLWSRLTIIIFLNNFITYV